MDYKEVTLENVGNGAAIDFFNEELKKVLENIADENTQPDAVRKITLDFKIKPSKDRSGCIVQVSSSCKLPSVKPHDGFMLLGYDGEKVTAHTHDTKQLGLFDEVEDENSDKIKNIKEA